MRGVIRLEKTLMVQDCKHPHAASEFPNNDDIQQV
jgi:hypothetical protein